jgi:hypothetical protein
MTEFVATPPKKIFSQKSSRPLDKHFFLLYLNRLPQNKNFPPRPYARLQNHVIFNL